MNVSTKESTTTHTRFVFLGLPASVTQRNTYLMSDGKIQQKLHFERRESHFKRLSSTPDATEATAAPVSMTSAVHHEGQINRIEI